MWKVSVASFARKMKMLISEIYITQTTEVTLIVPVLLAWQLPLAHL